VVITHYPAPRRSRLKKKSPCRWRTRCNSCPIWTTSAQFPPMVCRKSPSISPRIITPASCRKSGMSCAAGWATPPGCSRPAWPPLCERRFWRCLWLLLCYLRRELYQP
jgi:hypothetical protein